MDRLQAGLEALRARDEATPLVGAAAPVEPPAAGDAAAADPKLVSSGTGWKVRLDTGHHRSRSRWLGRDGGGRRQPPRSILVESTRCSVVVASRPARVLAAMVRAILDPEADGAAQPAAGGSGLVTVGGRSPADPTGVVQFAAGAGGADYLLDHADDARRCDPPGAGRDRPGLVERYSLTAGLDWWAGDLKGDAGRYRFRAYHRGAYHAEIRLQVPGVHQVLPALAAVAIGHRLAVEPREVKDRLEEFRGVPRGFESRGTFRGATLIDDEATESHGVAAALGLAREVFGGRTIRAVYLPHPAVGPVGPPLPGDFEEANHLIVVDGAPLAGDSTRLLAAGLRSSGASVVSCPSLDAATRELDRGLEPGDVLVMLGAGEVGTIADAFLRRLSRDRHR